MDVRDNAFIVKLRKRYRDPDIDHQSFDFRDMIYAFGSPFDALMYSKLLWPDFEEIEGMIFLEGTIDDDDKRRQLNTVFAKNKGDIAKTEEEFNLVEVPADLFGQRAGETNEEEDRWLAERLAQMWRARLSSLYPTREFVVKVLEPDETGGEIGIVFHQHNGPTE